MALDDVVGPALHDQDLGICGAGFEPTLDLVGPIPLDTAVPEAKTAVERPPRSVLPLALTRDSPSDQLPQLRVGAPPGRTSGDRIAQRGDQRRLRLSAGRRIVPAATGARKQQDANEDYDGPMSSHTVPGGVVHGLPADLREELLANATALDAWNDITPLARNEFICWVEDAKQETTRARRIRRTKEELEEGQRRPCCWPGCKHRERTGK